VVVFDGLRSLTHLSKGLVDDSGQFRVKLRIYVAHERFIVFELASQNCEVPVLVSMLCRSHIWKNSNILSISLSFPIDVDTRNVDFLTSHARRSMTRTLVFLLATVVACSGDSTIVACNWKVESGNGDFAIHQPFSCRES
jgi:hypothetical protein